MNSTRNAVFPCILKISALYLNSKRWFIKSFISSLLWTSYSPLQYLRIWKLHSACWDWLNVWWIGLWSWHTVPMYLSSIPIFLKLSNFIFSNASNKLSSFVNTPIALIIFPFTVTGVSSSFITGCFIISFFILSNVFVLFLLNWCIIFPTVPWLIFIFPSLNKPKISVVFWLGTLQYEFKYTTSAFKPSS